MIKVPEHIHSLLKRQLRQSQDDAGEVQLLPLINLVDETYKNTDEEQYLAHQSITLISQELSSLNEDLKKRAKDLKESEERYVLAALGANDGLWDWNILTDECFYSKRWKEIIGFTDEEDNHIKFTNLDSWFQRIHPSQRRIIKNALFDHIDGKTTRFEAEYQIKTKTGDYCWVRSRGIASRDENGKAIRIAGSQSDISQRKQYEEQLFDAAFHDKLTGLPNRALFMERLIQTMQPFKRKDYKKLTAVLFLDLDRFKIVNDSLGHDAGDQLLLSVARRLEMNLRPSDTICRLGGDEFTIVLSEVESTEHAQQIADRLIEEISKPYFIYSQQIFISSSIGIVVLDSYEEPETIMRNADLAMYQAKHNGKNRAEQFNKKQYDLIHNTLQIETDLRIALKNKEFIFFYQPIIEVKTGQVGSLEALMRWKHPEKGMISPAKFIPIAEETGIILQISEQMMEALCKQLVFWGSAFGTTWIPPVALNLSAKQLHDEAHLKKMIEIFEDSHLRKGSITFEITESVVIDKTQMIITHLNMLKEHGFKLSVDDFGTGYSSLTYLTELPFSRIKVDQSFVKDVLSNEKKKSIVRCIINLAKELDMDTVAEGVETIEMLTCLHKLGCDYAQGYLFSKPKSSLEILEFLEQHEGAYCDVKTHSVDFEHLPLEDNIRRTSSPHTHA